MAVKDKTVIVERKTKTYSLNRPVLPSCLSVPLSENQREQQKYIGRFVNRKGKNFRLFYLILIHTELKKEAVALRNVFLLNK